VLLRLVVLQRRLHGRPQVPEEVHVRLLGCAQPLLPLQRDGHLLIVGAASALAVVFAAALWGKVSHAGFVEYRRSAGLLWPGSTPLTPTMRHVLAVAVLGAEAVVTVVLIAGVVLTVPGGGWWAVWALSAGFLVAAVLLGAFTVGHAVARGRGRVVPCACFGRTTTTAPAAAMVRNGVLLVVAVAGLVFALLDADVAAAEEVLVAVLAGSVSGLLLVNMEELMGVFGSSRVALRERP